MTGRQSGNSLIARNTLFLYFRMIIIMAVSLYTSRVILKTLGVEDFGIYNLVGGISAMFQFLNGTLADATQRYITFEIGRGDQGNTNKIFSTCLMLHFILGIVLVLVVEPVGLWFLHNKLIIPPERLSAATWVFHLSVVNMFLVIICVPYNAMIIAYERMKAFAMISIIDAGFRLFIAYALLWSGIDKLIMYGLLILLLQAFLRFLYTFYCHKNFAESKYHNYWEKQLIKEMSGFASWTIIGNFAFVCVTQGISLILGMFFMPAVNAARGIAVQVQNAVVTFVKNFQTAINPQITKTYASGRLIDMFTLVFRGSRFSFYLILLPLLPILLETDIILTIWLTEVPEYTVAFIRLILFVSLINALSNPLSVAIKATGRIKEFEIFSATFKVLVIPVAYLFLYWGYSPVSVFVVYIILDLCAFISSLLITSHFVGFSIMQYLKSVVFRIVIVSIASSIIPLLFFLNMGPSIVRFICVIIVSLICSGVSIVYLGLTINERQFFLDKVSNVYHKLLKHGK